MGGSVGKALNPMNVLRGAGAAASMGTSEILQKKPFGLFKNPTGLGILGGNDQAAPGSGNFGFDPAQIAADKANILNLGDKQYADTMAALGTAQTANTQRAKDLFGQMLPDIAENAQAAHLYDSTGYGSEVARQQGSIASQLAHEESQAQLGALQGRQGFETGALQRGQSLEDFINQANVAKTIGGQMAPPPPSGKQNFGTVAQGIGALSPWGSLAATAMGGKGGSGGKKPTLPEGQI